MNADPHPEPTDRLRQILRQGDPAAQEPGLTPDETHAMRRAVLNASPEPRRQVAWLPLAATGAAALLALALAVAFGPWHRPPVSHPQIQVAAVPTPAASPAVPSVPAATFQAPVKSSGPAHRHLKRALRVRKALPIRQADSPVLVASLPVREIQFSTPGGTRVIWELPTQDGR